MATKTLSICLTLSSLANTAQIQQKLPSSCTNLADGEHYIQPLSSEQLRLLTDDDTAIAHPLHVICSNGYMIIDPIKDENSQLYFSSFHRYHYAFGGPDLDDHVIWKDWWLPSRYDTSITKEEDDNGILGSYFSIADNCQTCSDPATASKYPYQTTFYMTGDLYGCNWSNKNLCGFDLDTLECQICTNTFFDDEIMSDWGSCGHLPAPAWHTVDSDHDKCSTNGYMMLPSIGVTENESSNKFCVCYQPSDQMPSYFDSDLDDFDASTELDNQYNEINNLFDDDAQRVVHLSQSDFAHGTFRIKHPGKYTLTEDIILDFNAPTTDMLNDEDYSINGDKTAWFPHSDQNEEYPGATELDGWYWLGFYAGITVESDDVIIDLNGHSISMSYAFYLQQRWFVNILIANKPFIDTQGPTWTGAGFAPAARTLIKNGIVGLSSHHGILALNATDCVIENVHIKDFETHGLAVNEFHNLEVNNVEIGPSSRYVYLNGMYNLARMELPILRSAVADHGNELIEFLIPKVSGKRTNTFEELYNRLITQMDYAFNYVYNDITYDSSHPDYTEFRKAIDLFVNPHGISPHGVVYGAVFRPRGASIQNFGRLLSTETKSSNLIINNLEIHDLSIDVKEYFAMQGKTERWIRDPINGVLPLADVTIGFDRNLDDLVYVGNAWTDLIISLKQVSNSWWELGRMSMNDYIVNWATSGERLGIFYKQESKNNNQPRFCNMDALGHLVKGMLGIRMEWVNNVKINNLNIHDLHSLSQKGNDELCGNYVGTGHPVQSAYSNPGYGGINTYGMMIYEVTDTIIDGLDINNLVSYNGPTIGIKQFKLTIENDEEDAEPDVTLKNIEMKNFFAGTELKSNDGKIASWPNAAARACGLPENDMFYVENENKDNIPQITCLNGKADCMCEGETCYGEYNQCEEGIIPQVETPYHMIRFEKDKFEMESIDGFERLDVENEARPDRLVEILKNEPQRVEIELGNVEDMNMFDRMELRELDEDIVTTVKNNVSVMNTKAIFIGISIILITLSVIILFIYNKCESGELKLKKEWDYISV